MATGTKILETWRTAPDSGNGTQGPAGEDAIGIAIPSVPPAADFHISNMYVNAVTGRVIVEYEDIPGRTSQLIASSPPAGHLRVTGIYVDAVTGRTIVKYDDTPVP